MAGVSPEIVQRERWHQRVLIVADQEEPRRDVPVLPNRRAATRCSIVVGSAELSKCTTRVQRRVVLERDVGVGVVRSLQREARRSPVLPPVVVPLESVVILSLLPVEESHPCGPRLLVRAPEKTEVIDLESIGATQV